MGATWARVCDQHHLRRARIVNFTDTRFLISGTRLEFMGKSGFPFPVIFDSPRVRKAAKGYNCFEVAWSMLTVFVAGESMVAF